MAKYKYSYILLQKYQCWHLQLCCLSNAQKILNSETHVALIVMAKEKYTYNEFCLLYEGVFILF